MFKRDDYIRTKPEAVFSKWQGFTRSMLLRKPISETAEYRRALAEYSLISRDLGPKILIGAKNTEDYRKGKDRVGRYKVQGSITGICELGHDQDRKYDVIVANLGLAEAIRSRRMPYGRSIATHDMLKTHGDSEFMNESELGMSQTVIPIAQMKSGKRVEEKKHDSAEEREIMCEATAKESNFLASIHRLSRSRPQLVSDRYDDILDRSVSASVCGVLLEDGTSCTTTPIEGRKRCTEHKGKRLSSVTPKKHIPCEVPTQRYCEETENICGVILPDMVPCRRKPVSRRKRCEDHKGMRVNAFFFTMNATECKKTDKEDKSKSEICTGLNEESGPSLFCEDITKNGVIKEDGTTSTTTPIKGRKTCAEQKGKRVPSVSPEKHIQCEVPTRRESEITENICGVILPDMVPCRSKPEPRRKRCEDHKGMRVNAFFFLMDPTDCNIANKEDKSKSDICTDINENSDTGLFCEAITKNGLPCTRNAPEGSRRCWQHKDKTLEQRSSKSVQSASVSQVVCGAKLYDGSVCEKSPVKGRKRCEEHKGMRITS